MLQKENKKKILELFFDFPLKRFQLRQISRKTKIAITSVRKYVYDLIEEGFILKKEGGVYSYFVANRDNELFRFYKMLSIIERLKIIGLISYIEKKCFPDSIILFGSASLGEDIFGSDIDLFVQSKEIKLDLTKFEKKINRKINIFFKEDILKLNKELRNNILNGVKLYGYIDVFK